MSYIIEKSTWEEASWGKPHRMLNGFPFNLNANGKYKYLLKDKHLMDVLSLVGETQLDEFLLDFEIPFEEFKEFHNKWVDERYPNTHELFFQD